MTSNKKPLRGFYQVITNLYTCIQSTNSTRNGFPLIFNENLSLSQETHKGRPNLLNPIVH